MRHALSAFKIKELLMMQMDAISKKIGVLAKEGDARFLEIGRILREFYDTLAEEGGSKNEALAQLLAGAKIARRRAFYWIEIDRVYSDLKVPRKRLIDVGWTKLSVIAKHVDHDSIEAWLNFAEKSTAEELKAMLSGKALPTHTLTFKLTEKQYAAIAGTLLANGAYLTAGAGLANKEIALLRICKTLQKAWQAGIT
jgi:hypothetical protein